MVERSNAKFRHAYKAGFTDFKTLIGTFRAVTVKKERMKNTYAPMEVANTPSRDLQGTIIACDTFDYDMKGALAAVWTEYKISDSESYMTVYPFPAGQMVFFDDLPRRRRLKDAHNTRGQCGRPPETFRFFKRLRRGGPSRRFSVYDTTPLNGLASNNPASPLPMRTRLHHINPKQKKLKAQLTDKLH